MVSPNGAQGSPFQTMVRQVSIYYPPCSFDEVQSHMGNLGKSDMNLNEFVKNLVSSGSHEDARIFQNPSSSSSSSSLSSPSASYFLGNYINLKERLGKETIDEVWKEIVHQKQVSEVHNQSVQQQLTLGETTLEDCSLRPGVINRGNNNHNQNGVVNHHHQPFMTIDPMVVVSQQADWLHFQMEAAQHHHVHDHHDQMTEMDTSFDVSELVYDNPVADNIGYSENQLALTIPVPAAIPATKSDSKVNANERKRRYSNKIMEKTIERRQKRMIKNRESAARSRARKQAYINQLEGKVLWLRELITSSKEQGSGHGLVFLSNAHIKIPIAKNQLHLVLSSTGFI